MTFRQRFPVTTLLAGLCACVPLVTLTLPATANAADSHTRHTKKHISKTTAAAAPRADADVVTLNFQDADIASVVKAISDLTGKNFVLDPRVKGNINIVSAKPMSRSLVYQAFLSALRLQGFAAVEDRGVVKIVPEADARLQSGPAYASQDKPPMAGDQIQTEVFTLKYESATQMVPILRPLIAPNNTITAYPGNNTLVITDYASNLQRLERIINSVDQPSGRDPVVIPLRYASALDVVPMLNRLFSDSATAGSTDTSQQITIVADSRSNSVLARADNPSRLARLRSLIATLDTPTSAGGNIHVIRLRNAEAVKVAETLRGVLQGDSGSSGMRLPTVQAVTSPLAGGAGAPMASAPATLLTMSANANNSSGAIIQADSATNSVIITAPEAIYQNLRAALDKLDNRRAQVYVEALIAEITDDKAAEFGVQWQNLSGNQGDSSTRLAGGTNFGTTGQNILGIAQNPLSASAGLNIGLIRGTVNIPGVGQVLNLGVLVRALEADSSANILSTPTLLTLDNEEAKIVIGQNVPFITGQYALSGASTTPTPFQTIERRDVGLTLRIKPQISEGGTVRMQIFQEVSSVDNTVVNSAGVVTNKRAVDSMVLVDNGQIVVIGGLIQDSVKDSVQKVPVLGNIPFLGQLFQYKSRERTKTNLMVFLRPTVIRNAGDTDAITGDRYDYILKEQLQPPSTTLIPSEKRPTLPPLSPAPIAMPVAPATAPAAAPTTPAPAK